MGTESALETLEKLRKMTPSAVPEEVPPGEGGAAACPRQAMQTFTVNLQCPQSLELEQADRWIEVALAMRMDIAPADSSVPLTGDAPSALAANLVLRASLLARIFLQTARVPVFDAARLLDLRQDPRTPQAWTATLALAKIDLIPTRCYAIAVNEALRFVQWMARTPPTAANRELLYKGMQERVLGPMQKMIPGGKSTIQVLHAAYQLHIPFCHLGAGVYQLGWGSQSRHMDRSTTDADSAIGARLSRNKVSTASLLQLAGLPAPVHALTHTEDEALGIATDLGWPVVVKPVDGERGEGVTVDVVAEPQLRQAYTLARGASAAGKVLVERQVPGVCHRLFIAGGRLLYAVKRLPKSIHGDGLQTIEALVAQANHAQAQQPPWLRSEPFPMDSMAVEAITQAGFSIKAVPPAGQRIPLRRIESTEWGGFDEDVTHHIHPDNLDIALRATALFGLEVAGIDIITPDISVAWHGNGAVINEVNFAPLLGGGEISRQHLPAFLATFITGRGRIPVEVFVGDQTALDAARERQKALVSTHGRCFASSHAVTLSPSGEVMHFAFESLHRRCRALLLNSQVDALVVVVQTDEFLHTGLPVDHFDHVTLTNSALRDWKRPAESPSPAACRALLQLLGLHPGA